MIGFTMGLRNFFMRFSLVAFVVVFIISFAPYSFASDNPSGTDSLPGQQTPDNICLDVMRQALAEFATSCASSDPNSACYGFKTVAPSFADNTSLDTFSETSDQVELTTLADLLGSKFDKEAEDWGIALLKFQANLPASLSSDAARLVLLGDVRIENDVEPPDALLLPAEPLVTAAIQDADLLAGADAAADMVGSVEAGAELEIDGISPDGAWLRVYYEYVVWREYSKRATAWISREAVDADLDTSALPEIAPDSLTPWQHFYMITATNGSECAPAPPPLVYIQGPHQIEVDFRVNGADIRISSDVVLHLIAPRVMELIVLTGVARVYPETPDEIVVPAGYSTTICLTEDQDLGINRQIDDREVDSGCKWSAPVPMTLGQIDTLTALEQLPENVLIDNAWVPELSSPSGVGNVQSVFIFDNPNETLKGVTALCAQGQLPANTCAILGVQ